MNPYPVETGHRSEHPKLVIWLTVGLLPLGIILLLNAVHIVQYAHVYLNYPYSIDYGEGIVWQQMRDIVAGGGYSPLGVYPAIVYHYPPVYHLTTAGLAWVADMDQLSAGRLVSLLSTSASAVLVSVLASNLLGCGVRREAKLVCVTIAALLLISCDPVIKWSATMRVDMLSGAFALAGLVLIANGIARPIYITGAAILFTLSVFTKQTSIAAPASALIALALVSPREAMRLLITCSILGLTIAGWLTRATDGGFLRHILLYNVNRLDLTQFGILLHELAAHLSLIIVALIGAWHCFRSLMVPRNMKQSFVTWRIAVQQDKMAFTGLLLLVFLLIKTIMLSMILKSGANINYMIEWFCALIPFSAIAAYRIYSTTLSRKHVPLIPVVLLLVCIPLQIAAITRWNATSLAHDAQDRIGAIGMVVAAIRQSSKPVISDDMTLPIRAGKRVEWEPAITAELGQVHIYDQQQFVDMVRRGDFAFFVTEDGRGSRVFDSRYNPAVADAMDAAYPRKKTIAGLLIHLPQRSATQ